MYTHIYTANATSLHTVTCMYTEVMIMASHQTFSSQIKHMFGQIKFGLTNFYTLSMEVLWSLQKKMNVWTISGPYHKHWFIDYLP